MESNSQDFTLFSNETVVFIVSGTSHNDAIGAFDRRSHLQDFDNSSKSSLEENVVERSTCRDRSNAKDLKEPQPSSPRYL